MQKGRLIGIFIILLLVLAAALLGSQAAAFLPGSATTASSKHEPAENPTATPAVTAAVTPVATPRGQSETTRPASWTLNEPSPVAGFLVINEVLAANRSSRTDENGDHPDWLELYNAGQNALDLTGFYLSNVPGEPFLWCFPEQVLQPGSYLLIFASGKNQGKNALHTNFRLDPGQDLLELRDASGRIIDSLTISGQLQDVSFGRNTDDPAGWLYYPQPTPGGRNDSHGFASLQLSTEAASLIITEVMNMNTRTLSDQAGEYPDWVELFNPGSAPVSLLDFGLADQADPGRLWRFPDLLIQPGEHLLVFASGQNSKDPSQGPLHTDFALNTAGEFIVLFDPFGRILDRAEVGWLGEDISFGRAKDLGAWLFFEAATPGKANGDNGFPGYAGKPAFSQTGGFFQGSVHLSLSSPGPDAEVRYTLDGSGPTKQSARYAEPLLISKTTVVRAAVFRPGFMPGPAVAQTYLIDVRHALPVVSLALNPQDFDHPITGIYSKGLNASSVFPFFGANFHKDLEVPAAWQFFEKDGQPVFQMNVGLKIFGGWTRAYDQKSLALYARNSYESNVMAYPFLNGKSIGQFKHLVLRTGGQDVYRSKIRDILATRLVADTSLDYQGYRQVVLYINGRYWGVYSIREKVDRYFFQYNHGIEDPGMIDLLEGNGSVKAGDNAHYKALMAFIAKNDLAEPVLYEAVKTMIDVETFMDYMILAMYSANTDSGNIRFWRDRSGDGRWRWMTYDLDMGFGGGAVVSHDSVWFMINPAGTGAGNQFSTALIRSLLRNSEFRQEFIARFADQMHHLYNPERVISIIDELAAEIEPEITMNSGRWSRPASLRSWRSEVEVLRNFARKRPAILLQHLKQHLGLSEAEMALFP